MSRLAATKNKICHPLKPTLAFGKKKAKVAGSKEPPSLKVRERIVTVFRSKTGLDLRVLSCVPVTSQFLTIKDKERLTQFLKRLELFNPIAMAHGLIYPADQGRSHCLWHAT